MHENYELSPIQSLSRLSPVRGIYVSYAAGPSALIVKNKAGGLTAVPVSGLLYGQQSWLSGPDINNDRIILTNKGHSSRFPDHFDGDTAINAQPNAALGTGIYAGGAVIASAPGPVVGCALTTTVGRTWVICIVTGGSSTESDPGFGVGGTANTTYYEVYMIPLKDAHLNFGTVYGGGADLTDLGEFDNEWRKVYEGYAFFDAGRFFDSWKSNDHAKDPWHFNGSGTAAVITAHGWDLTSTDPTQARMIVFRADLDTSTPTAATMTFSVASESIDHVVARSKLDFTENKTIENSEFTNWTNVEYVDAQTASTSTLAPSGGVIYPYEWREHTASPYFTVCGDFLNDDYVEYQSFHDSQSVATPNFRYDVTYARPAYKEVTESTPAIFDNPGWHCPAGFTEYPNATPGGEPFCYKGVYTPETITVHFESHPEAFHAYDLEHTLYPTIADFYRRAYTGSYDWTVVKDSTAARHTTSFSQSPGQAFENWSDTFISYIDPRLGIIVAAVNLSTDERSGRAWAKQGADSAVNIRETLTGYGKGVWRVYYKNALLLEEQDDQIDPDTGPSISTADTVLPSGIPYSTQTPLDDTPAAVSAGEWLSFPFFAYNAQIAAGCALAPEFLIVSMSWTTTKTKAYAWMLDKSTMDIVGTETPLLDILTASAANFSPSYFDGLDYESPLADLVAI